MAHILILDEWEALLGQLHDYSFTIKNNIDNNLYHGNDLTAATNLVESVESLMDDINTAKRAALDTKVSELETFLGI